MTILVEHRACTDCGRTMSSQRPKPPAGMVRYGAFGRCCRCDRALSRAGASRKPQGRAERVVHALPSDVWPARA